MRADKGDVGKFTELPTIGDADRRGNPSPPSHSLGVNRSQGDSTRRQA